MLFKKFSLAIILMISSFAFAKTELLEKKNIFHNQVKNHSYRFLKPISSLFFKNKIKQKKNISKIKSVWNYPIVDLVVLSGNSMIPEKIFQHQLIKTGVLNKKGYHFSSLKKFINIIKNIYHDIGYLNVSVDITTLKKQKNHVDLKVSIIEGFPVVISNIVVHGNKKFSNFNLIRKLPKHDTTVFWNSLFTKTYNSYDFNNEIKNLVSFYKSYGFLDFKISRINFVLSKDKNNVYIEIYVNEGKQYYVQDIIFHGNFLKFKKKFQGYIYNFLGKNYKKKYINKIFHKIKNMFIDQGYYKSRISYYNDINSKNNNIITHFFIKPGKQYLIKNIFFKGNILTKEFVLKNIIRLNKGEYFKKSLLDESNKNLKNTGFFEKVITKIDIKREKYKNYVNISFILKESDNLEKFNFSTGYNFSDGLLFNFVASKDNFLGSGINTILNVEKRSSVVNSNFSFVPNFNMLHDVYFKTNFFLDSIKEYNREFDKKLLQKFMGFESVIDFSDINNKDFFLSLGFLKTYNLDFLPEYFAKKYSKTCSHEVYHDDQSKRFFSYDMFIAPDFSYHTNVKKNNPYSGQKFHIFGKFSLPYSHHKIHGIVINSDKYYSLDHTDSIILHLNNQLGLGLNLSNMSSPFFNSNELITHVEDNVRGFDPILLNSTTDWTITNEDNRILKDIKKINHDITEGFPIRGHFSSSANIELLFPNIGNSIDFLKSLQTGIFLDTSSISRFYLRSLENETFISTINNLKQNNLNSIRASTGVFFSWISSFGPIKVTLSYLLNCDKNRNEFFNNINIDFKR